MKKKNYNGLDIEVVEQELVDIICNSDLIDPYLDDEGEHGE